MIFSQFITGCMKKSFHKIQRTSFLPYNFQPRIGNVEESSIAGRSRERREVLHHNILGNTSLFHLSHNSKDNFSPSLQFHTTKKEKGHFLQFKTLLQFYRGKFHCKSSKSLVFHTNQEKEGFLLICPLSLSLLISPNLSQDSTRP